MSPWNWGFTDDESCQVTIYPKLLLFKHVAEGQPLTEITRLPVIAVIFRAFNNDFFDGVS